MNELRVMNDLFDAQPMEQLMRNLLRPWPVDAGAQAAPRIRIDLAEDEAAYTLKADIPGVKKEDIDVRVDGRQVTISAEVKQQTEERSNGGRVLRSERRVGYASRSLALDCAVDEGKAEAQYRDGVLELRLPKKAGSAAGRKLSIGA